MTSEDLKLVIRTVLDETGFKQAKKSAADLGNAMEKQGKQTSSAFGEGTEGAKNLYDQLDAMRHMDFPELLVNLTSIGASAKLAMTASKKSIADLKFEFDSLGGFIEMTKDEIKEFEQKLKDIDSGKIDFKFQEDMDDAVRETKNEIDKLNTTLENYQLKQNDVKNSIKKFGGEGSKAFGLIDKSALKVLGTIAAITAAVMGLIAATRNAINTAIRMKELYYEASSLGLTVSQYQEWGYIFESVGESVNDLADAVKTLSSEQAILAEGSDGNKAAFKELGLSVAEVTKMTQDDLFRETVTRLQNVEDAVKRTTLAYQIFGEDTAARLTNVLNLNNAEMVKLSENFYLLGGGASSGFIEKSRTLASSIQSLRVAWTGLTNTLAEIFMPVVTTVVNALTKAIVVVNLFLKTIFGLDFSPAAETAGVASGGISGIGDAASGAKDEVEKLKRATMGFDELNIVTNPASSKSDDGGAGGGLGDGAIGVTESAFDKAKVKLDDFKNKVQDFLDKWETQIKIIGAALGTWGAAKLIGHFGKLLGLSDNFLKALGEIKKFAKTAIIITLQYSAVNEFMDNFMDGGSIKDYIAGLISAALGTGILYKMWGPGGLVIGLGVTAVASIKAVIDNGGITDAESATVAFTGLASAIGAVGVASKAGAFAKIGAALGSIKTALAPVISALGSFAGAIGAAFGLTGGAAVAAGAAVIAAAIAAIASVVVFLKNNWEGVTAAFKNFFSNNIAPKLEGIKESFVKIKDALWGVVEAFIGIGQAIWNALPASVQETLSSIGTKIKEIVTAIGEWFASIDWLDAIGAAFEFIGGVIFGVVSGVIMGAINMVVGIFEGFAQAFSGVVQIIGGAVEAIVKLFSGDLQGALDAVKQIGQGIVDVFSGLWKMVITPVQEFVTGVIDFFVQLWDELVGHSIVPDMINAIVDWFKNMPGRVFEAVQEFVDGVITRIKKLWSDITGWFGTNVAPKFTKQYWVNKFDTVRAAAQEKFTAVKNTIQGIWNNIKTWFGSNIAPKFTASYWTNKFGSVKTGAKSAFNGVIGVVEGAVNGIIGKVNTLSWTIPDWVPKFGGDKFGFNFKSISIPRLATGGITTGSVVANIGENGREAVLPLDKNTAWMDRLADRIAARNGSPTKVVLKVGERELGEATIHAINQNTRMNGGLQLQLV